MFCISGRTAIPFFHVWAGRTTGKCERRERRGEISGRQSLTVVDLYLIFAGWWWLESGWAHGRRELGHSWRHLFGFRNWSICVHGSGRWFLITSEYFPV